MRAISQSIHTSIQLLSARAPRILVAALALSCAILCASMYGGADCVYNGNRECDFESSPSSDGYSVQYNFAVFDIFQTYTVVSGLAPKSSVAFAATATPDGIEASNYELQYDYYLDSSLGGFGYYSDTNGVWHDWTLSIAGVTNNILYFMNNTQLTSWLNSIFGRVNPDDVFNIVQTDYIVGVFRQLTVVHDIVNLYLPYIRDYVSYTWINGELLLEEFEDYALRFDDLYTLVALVNGNSSSINSRLFDVYWKLVDVYTRQGYVLNDLSTIGNEIVSTQAVINSLQTPLTSIDITVGNILTASNRLFGIADYVSNIYAFLVDNWYESRPVTLTASSQLSAIANKLDTVVTRLNTIIALMQFEQASVLEDLIGDFDFTQFYNDTEYTAYTLRDIFPFCLVEVAVSIVSFLNQTPVAPTWTFQMPTIGQSTTPVVIDLTGFEALRNFSGFICYVGVVMGLVFGTRKVLFGGGT